MIANLMIRSARISARLVLGATVIATFAQPAHAVVDVICSLHSVVTFTPGLRLHEQMTHTTFDVDYDNCVSLTRPDITAGGRSGSFDRPRGCLTVPPGGARLIQITWNTGEVSVIEATAQSVDSGGQTVYTLRGTVIEGPFTGQPYLEEIVQLSPDLLYCLFPPGITSQQGIGLVEIL